MTELQRHQLRILGLFGIGFNIFVGITFVASAVILGFNTDYIDEALQGTAQPLIDQPSATAYPYWVLLVFILNLPFFFGNMISWMRARLLLNEVAFFWRDTIVALNIGGMISAVVLMLVHTYGVLYAANAAEIRTAMVWYLLGVYLNVMFSAPSIIIFGIVIYRQGLFPRALASASIGIGGLAILANILAVNTDLPSLRITMPLPLVTVELLVWSMYLYLVSQNRSTEDETITLAH